MLVRGQSGDFPGLEGDACEDYSNDTIDKEIIFRYSGHTGFFPEIIRLQRGDLDIIPSNVLSQGKSVPEDIMVDIILSEAPDDQ